jgi:hypothetical protein
VELLGGGHSGFAGATASHPQDPDHLHLAVAGRGGGRGHPGQGGPGGGLGIDRIGLAPAPAGAAVGAVDLDHLEAVGAGETGQASAVGASAFNADALHRPEAFGPGHQGDIAAGRGREPLGVQQPPRLVDHRGHVLVQMRVDPDGDRWGGGWHAFHDRSFRLIGQGRHAPIGTVDSTAMGPLARLLSGHSARPVGAFMCLRQLADRSNARHQAGETSGQTSPGGHHPDHRSKNFLYHPQGRPCGRPPPAAVLGRQATRRPPGSRPHPLGELGAVAARWEHRRSYRTRSRLSQ